MNRLQDLNTDTNILIVGLGVIGGGYASALSKKGYRVRCITKEQKDIDYALERGMIFSGSTEVDAETVGAADLIIFALYPHIFIEWIEKNQKYLKKGALLTDVTGVKRNVVYKVQDIFHSKLIL